MLLGNRSETAPDLRDASPWGGGVAAAPPPQGVPARLSPSRPSDTLSAPSSPKAKIPISQELLLTIRSRWTQILAVVFSHRGSDGLGGFSLLFAGSSLLTAVFLGIAALLSAGAIGRRRTRALALALVVWFVAVVLLDVAALGVASVLKSGTASRVLILSVIVNPVGALRTGALLALQGTTAFGAASLAFLRFTKGTTGAFLLLSGSLILWTVIPFALAARRLSKTDV